jgi:hypothetical protein
MAERVANPDMLSTHKGHFSMVFMRYVPIPRRALSWWLAQSV